MQDGDVKVAIDAQGLAEVALDRPPANALTAAFLERIDTLFAELAKNPKVRAVVLTGQGRALSAGMDLKALPNLDAAGQTRTVDALNAAYRRLYAFPKPLVAAANGAAVAGGLFFLLTADHRIAAQTDARFGLSEVRVGAPFPIAALEIACAELPAPAARRLLLSGELIDAAQAQAAGVLDEIAPPDSLLETARGRAAASADSPAESYAAIKAQLRAAALARIDAVLSTGDPMRSTWLVGDPAASIERILRKTA